MVLSTDQARSGDTTIVAFTSPFDSAEVWVTAERERVLDLDDLDAFARTRLSAAKLPRHYHVELGLPRNANGKADRTSVLDALRRALEPKRE
jgi:acyl-CoA synthetase (AMP-forming)/AMP-acid ligase II